MKATTLVISFIWGAAACGGDSNDKPKDASPGADAPALPTCANPVSGTNIRFRQIGTVGSSAVLVTAPPNDPRLFVVDQAGQIRIFENEVQLPMPFLDLTPDNGGPVANGADEQGLLGLAFHPKYASNGSFFVFYTTARPTLRNVLARCSVSANPNVANPTCTEVLSIPDFASNHNGGMIEFGNDGLLYISTGDGGDKNDPRRNGQSLRDGSPLSDSVALLGKILRIDVDNKAPGKEYGVPADNPFADGVVGAPEIFIIGLRNPWRWSFDRATGDMWIADVGQGRVEELTVLTPAQQKGANLGWSIYEGSECFVDRMETCPPATTTKIAMPQFERTHASGWGSITGGQVYRGTCFPDLVGQYFFADYISADYVRATFADLLPAPLFTVTDIPDDGLPAAPSSIHADARGELYLTTSPQGGPGSVFHLEAAP